MKSLLRACSFVFVVLLFGCGGGGGGTNAPPASTYSLSGTVSGAVLPGVTINLTGAATENTLTDASGDYSFTDLEDGSYTVTPSRSGYSFTPTSRVVSVNGADVSGANFTATANGAASYSISGAVSGAVQAGVTLTLSGSATGLTTTSNASGGYTFPGLANGSYTVTPSLTGYSFTPGTIDVVLAGADSAGNDFTATSSPTLSYSYYKRYGTTTPQTATLANGTLSIDGKTISGVYTVQGPGGSTCLAGGNGTELTACWSPADAPQTMLLCGPDPVTSAPDTLLYVLFDTPDANRVATTATAFLAALQSETNYLGTSVYTNCSGWADTSWIRDYPSTNYYLWPDVFSSYSGTYVANLLAGMPIFSTPDAGSNYKEYVAVRVSATVFEVWH